MPAKPDSPKLVGFSDESCYNTGRYRSVALVSLEHRNADAFHSSARQILDNCHVRELKWSELNSAKEQFAAYDITDFVIQKAIDKCLRVDVLTWDSESRQHIANRKDAIENLERMYYQLFKNVLRERWPDDSNWHLYPDEHTGLNWKSIESYLSRVSVEMDIEPTLGRGWNFNATLRKEFKIQHFQACKSHETPIIQIADFFAGIAAYSWQRFGAYEFWENSQTAQGQLFPQEAVQVVHVSNRDKHRFKVLRKLNETCKAFKLGVSLKSFRGLRTLKPQYPINFWMFDPPKESRNSKK